jgi:hypothetical protein
MELDPVLAGRRDHFRMTADRFEACHEGVVIQANAE